MTKYVFIILCGILLLTATTYAGPLDNNLIAYWQFNQTSGNAVDTSGSANSHEAVWNAGSSYSDAGDSNYNFENSLYLDGSDSNYLTVSDHSDFNFANGLTIIMWIKPLKTDGLTMLHKWRLVGEPYSNSIFTFIVDTTGVMQVQTQPNPTSPVDVQSTTGVISDEWQQVATTYDPIAEVWTIYHNGYEVYSQPVSGTLNDSPNDLFIGHNPNYAPSAYYGWMDEIRLYDTALDSSLILAEFQATSAIPEPASILLVLIGVTGLVRRKRN